MAAQGIDYLLAIAPGKSTIYPHFEPANVPRPGIADKRLDQVVRFLAENAPAAIMVRDSFGTALIPFVSGRFRRIVYLHPFSMDEAVLLRERPSIVIEETAERELQAATPPRWGKE